MKNHAPFFKEIKTEKGQSLVEFSVSLIIILLILAGTVDLGRMFFYYISMRDAAQEGVLYGSAFPCEYEEIEKRARDLVSGDIAVIDVTLGSKTYSSGMTTDTAYKTAWETIAKDPTTTTIIVRVHDDNFQLSMPFFGGWPIELGATVNATVLRNKCID